MSVACPATTLCVATAGADLLVSQDPAGGSATWTTLRAADASTSECGFHDYCSDYLIAISCASTTSCTAVDNEGGTVTGDPLTGQWAGGYPAGIGGGVPGSAPGVFVNGLACLPGTGCVMECEMDAGLGWDLCPDTDGSAYGPDDICSPTSACFTFDGEPLAGIWCQPPSLCFASDVIGDLFASTDPASGQSLWNSLYTPPSSNHTSYRVVGARCTSATVCIAATDMGEILVGAPPPTTGQLRTFMVDQLVPPAADMVAKSLLSHDGFSLSFTAWSPGQLELMWSVGSATVVARGHLSYSTAAKRAIQVIFTAAGKRLLRKSRQFRVVEQASFTESTGLAVTGQRKLLVR